MNGSNLYSRVAPMGPAHLPVATFTADPVQARAMDLDDIADLRRWHRAAVRRALRAGYDLVYVYSGHALGGIHHFLSRRYNDRTDAYGGSARNRMRLLREILEDTLEEAGGRAAVACRITVDELLGDEGITREDIEEVIGELGELPDLWDFVLGSWEDDSVTARFGDEAAQEAHVRGLKALTSKPVVGVGRFTSPDTMVRMVSSGVLDMIGAARPSIADPFLPRKIEEGRLRGHPRVHRLQHLRCRGLHDVADPLHPEPVDGRGVAPWLAPGADPAAHQRREGARRRRRPGGSRGRAEPRQARVRGDPGGPLGPARRPGRAARRGCPGWPATIRVADYRLAQLRRLRNVEQAEGEVTAEEILDYDFAHVAVATGARWRDDGVGRFHTRPIERDPALPVLTPDDLMAGSLPEADRVVIYDDDHYYMGGVLAELLVRAGRQVTLVTPAGERVELDDEHDGAASHPAPAAGARRRDRRLARGRRRRRPTRSAPTCVFTGRERELPTGAAVFVTARLPRDAVYRELLERRDALGRRRPPVGQGRRRLSARPGTIAAAVWEGHRYAEELDEPDDRGDTVPFRREVTELAPD